MSRALIREARAYSGDEEAESLIMRLADKIEDLEEMARQDERVHRAEEGWR